MVTLVSSVLMISVKPGILYELNQYRKANNVDWEGFYVQVQVLTEEKVPNWQR